MDTQQQKPSDRAAQAELFEDPEIVGTWLQLVRTFSRVAGLLEQAISRHGLTIAQFDVLATLHLREGVTQQELASHLLVTKGNVCGLLHRMEVSGLIERRPDPRDRRANRIHLCPAGRERFRSASPDHDGLLRAALGHMTGHQREDLVALLRQIEQTLLGTPRP